MIAFEISADKPKGWGENVRMDLNEIDVSMINWTDSTQEWLLEASCEYITELPGFINLGVS